jgi:hypothetical protein
VLLLFAAVSLTKAVLAGCLPFAYNRICDLFAVLASDLHRSIDEAMDLGGCRHCFFALAWKTGSAKPARVDIVRKALSWPARQIVINARFFSTFSPESHAPIGTPRSFLVNRCRWGRN